MKISSLPDLSIQKPVLATVMSLVIVFAGFLAWSKLPVREYPDIDPPVITITTVYPGASSTVIESEITDLIESEFSGITGIKTMTSSSRDQVSTIVLEFVLERNIDIAAQDVRDKVARISRKLPDNADDPIIAKADADAQPIMWIKVQSKSLSEKPHLLRYTPQVMSSLTAQSTQPSLSSQALHLGTSRTDSPERNLIDLAEYVDQEIKDYFQNVPGVSKVIFGGERRRSIQVLLDTKKLAYYGLTVIDIEKALDANNIELPAGTILSKTREFSINVNAKLTTPEEYANISIKDSSFGLVKLKDVAQVILGAQNDKSFVRFNGQQGFGLGIVRQAQSNTVKISDAVHKLIKELEPKIPEDIELEVGYDAAQFIRLSLQELYTTIFQATLLVLLVIFVFLRNIRTTLIPSLAIPISLVGVMIGIQAFGFTLNQMTLLGLIIAIGIVVDDSIIVLENIYRYIEEGMDAKAAAKKGAEEITFAVIATTLVLISIFLPVAFLSGITGRLLSEFAFSLCFATSISSFVALTIVPMLCSRVFVKIPSRSSHQGSTFYNQIKIWLERLFVRLEQAYASMLDLVLKHKNKFVSIVLLVSVFASVFLFNSLPKDFIPNEDRGTFFVIFKSPRGSNIDVIDKQIRKVETLLAKIPEIATTISVAAFGRDAPGKVTEGIIITRLKHWKERARKVGAIVGPLYPQLFAMPEVFTLPIMPKSGPDSGFGSQPIQLVLKSNNLDFLVKASAAITQQSATLPAIMFARSNLSLDKPELTVDINREKAQSLGLSMEDISKSIELLFTGIDVTEFNDKGENYKVILTVARDQKDSISKIGEFALRNQDGRMIQLSNLITVRETIGAEDLNHHNRKKSVTIEASPQAGVTPSDGLMELERLAKTVIAGMENVPADFEMDYLGTSKELQDSNAALYFGFVIALIFAYLFLAGQFESFLSPVIIMLTVPLALVGALFGIFVFQFFPWITHVLTGILGEKFFWLQYAIPQFKNISLNLYSQVGMIMLIGMATKNGILLVEFMNQLREQGMSTMDAIKQAARLRLRPVLMTAVSTILGLLPIALALGIGTESRQSLGVVIIAGMTVATVLTLVLVPAVYAVFYQRRVVTK
ncbi:MAG: efflux RND transporter permease subunit [Cyanobacteria bacterium]|nr:efflux RND transporter permease subunit [Cyanobacteriota bacterium]